MTVKLISVTPDAEKIVGYCARVSNPNNQSNPDVAKLLAYCIKNHHWSIFETSSMTVEITTSRAISRQILRHRSFTFQEFSQRYAKVPAEPVYADARRQDSKNRQSSIDDLPDYIQDEFQNRQERFWKYAMEQYQWALSKGIAKECARTFMPEMAQSKLYMTGNIRSWIHYLQLRTGNGTQLEHQDIANDCRIIFEEQFPIISKALGWK